MIALRAPWVAYKVNFVHVDVGEIEMAIMNLRVGGWRRCSVGTWSSAGGTWFAMTGLVVSKFGGVGWAGKRENPLGDQREIATCAGKSMRLLDSGLGIALHSLRLREPFLRWVHDGQTKQFRLR
ncbi:MAG TPA: hypothetical protein VFN18_11555 [Solirubrobacterales bacterium]|nr:hypothetical protein [Solirubrobacterales bacterium]